jgi:TctA family transporter
MWIGNFMLLVLNLPLIGMWVKLLTVPYRMLFPAIMAVCSIGVYSVSNNPVDVYAMAFFGVIGYAFIKLDCEPAPLLLGFVIAGCSRNICAGPCCCRAAIRSCSSSGRSARCCSSSRSSRW